MLVPMCVFMQETLQLVRTHYAIMNANAFLLEQVGDVSGAMNLILAHLDRLLTDLKVCVCVWFVSLGAVGELRVRVEVRVCIVMFLYSCACVCCGFSVRTCCVCDVCHACVAYMYVLAVSALCECACTVYV